MADKQQSPFTGLDKALLRSTRVKEPLPADQQPSEPVSHLTSLPANQQASMPVTQPDSVRAPQLVKATFYLTDDHIMQLEQIRLERKRRGEKVDKSALVREAIEQLASTAAKQ